MESDKSSKTNSVKEKSNVDDQIKSVLSKSPSSNMPKNKRIILSLLVGLGAALLGAVLWFAIAALFKIQLGYIAILVGLFVGFGMKFILKEINMLPMGIAAALLSVFGILMGTFMIWYFQTPIWFRQTVVEEYGITDNEANVYFSDDMIRENITFGNHLEAELLSSEYGNNPLVSWLFYILALYIGFSRVYSFKKKTNI